MTHTLLFTNNTQHVSCSDEIVINLNTTAECPFKVAATHLQ